MRDHECYPSRSEGREAILNTLAENGKYSFENELLYPNEITKLERQGFLVSKVRPSGISKNLYFATIDWSRPYINGIPHIVYSHIIGIVQTYPEKSVTNFAQALYIVASKYNHRRK